MRALLKDNRGFALILTILVISLIVMLTLQFNISMRTDLTSSVNLKDGIVLNAIARSGFNCAMGLLSEDGSANEFDSLNEMWARPEVFSEVSGSMFEEGRFMVEISDLSGKIQINQLVDKNGKVVKAQRDLLERFLGSEVFGIDPDAITDLVDAIKDWIDTDDHVTRFGAENGYYNSLEKSYSCKNAPLEFLSELLLIRGMTKEFFYGTKEKQGISGYLSVYGDGRININTAPPIVLKALSKGLDDEMVDEILSYRLDEKNDLVDPNWYKEVTGQGHVVIDSSLISTSSSYFEIESKGIKDSMSRIVTGKVKREKGADVRLLSWKIE